MTKTRDQQHVARGPPSCRDVGDEGYYEVPKRTESRSLAQRFSCKFISRRKILVPLLAGRQLPEILCQNWVGAGHPNKIVPDHHEKTGERNHRVQEQQPAEYLHNYGGPKILENMPHHPGDEARNDEGRECGPKKIDESQNTGHVFRREQSAKNYDGGQKYTPNGVCDGITSWIINIKGSFRN